MDYHLKTCVIVAGGWSVSQYKGTLLTETAQNIHRAVTDIITVNDAFRHVALPSCVVTMDRKWLEHRFEEADKRGIPVYYRRSTVGKKSPLAGKIDQYVHQPFANNNSPGAMMGQTVPFTLDGNNSGACALNLAYIRRYPTVYLLGFDMQKGPNGENHFYPDYEWNKNCTKPAALAGWAGSFREASDQFVCRGIRVFNVNDRSLIKDFPIISFDEFRRLTR